MKTGWTLILLTGLTLIIGLSGCAKNKTVSPPPDPNLLTSGPAITFPLLTVPAWILYPESAETSIGLTPANLKHPQKAVEAAREFARQSRALNNCTFEFNSAEAVQHIDWLENPASSFAFKITFLPEKDALEPTDPTKTVLGESSIRSYEAFLFGQLPTKVNNDLVEISAASMPKWALTGVMSEDSQYIYPVGMSEHTSLTEAWRQAQMDALRRLCLKRLTKLDNSIKATADSAAQFTLADTAKQSAAAQLAKTWIFLKTTDGKLTYNVAMMLKCRK